MLNFNTGVPQKMVKPHLENISLHLKNIFKETELNEILVTEEYSATASDGKKLPGKTL